MSTDTQPSPEIVVTANEWFMNTRLEQSAAFESWLDQQTGITEIAAWIDAFAIDGADLWCRWMYDTLPTDWTSRWKRWTTTSPLPAEVAALILGLRRDR